MLPQYQFVSLLGRGGMGAVYKAVQVTLDRPVAIKVLPVDLIEDDDAQFAERFKNEARTMAKMNHPAIVNVYDFGETNTGLLYIVMEFIDGTDIAQMIASQGRLPEDYALSITAHVSDALNYAHARGVIHRDIKPANILINMEGAVKVADFGLAKQNDPGQSGITKTNMAMGTPDFVAPEALIAGIPLDGRADLYAMGVMLYQMLTGEIPRGMWSMPSKKLGTDPRFDEIISKAMQADRERRYQSAADLRRDLDTILTTPRAVLIQQQQAATEAKAASSARQRPKTQVPLNTQAPPEEVPPQRRSPSLVGPVLGALTVLGLIVGAFFMLRPVPVVKSKQASKAQIVDTPQEPPTSAPAAGSDTLPNDGEWLDLLPSLENPLTISARPDRDPIGTWNSSADTVTVEQAGVNEAVVLPVKMPDSYELSLRIKSEGPATSHVGILLPIGGKLIKINNIQQPPNSEGLTIINQISTGNAPPRNQDIKKSFLRQNLESLVEIAVRTNQRDANFTLRVDGQLFFEWSGPKSNIRTPPIHGPFCPQDNVAFTASNKATAFFKEVRARRLTGKEAEPVQAATTMSVAGVTTPSTTTPVPTPAPAPEPSTPITPVQSSTEQPENLLTLVDLDRHVVPLNVQAWKRIPEGIQASNPQNPGNKKGTLQIPVQLAPSYAAEVSFTTSQAEGEFGFVLPLGNGHQVACQIGGNREGYAGISLVDGKKLQDSGSPTEYAKPFKLTRNQPTSMRVEVRRLPDKVDIQFSINGDPTAAYQGPAEKLSLSPEWHVGEDKNALYLGCVHRSGGFGTTFKELRVEALDLKKEAITVDPHIARLEAGFKARYETDVEKPYQAAVASLNKSYINNGIAKARAAAQSRGSLKEVVAFDDVKARIERGEGVPEEDAPDTPESLKSLRAIYRSAMTKINSERDARAAPLYDVYVRALDAYIAELTMADKADEARQVSMLRDEIAGKRPLPQVVAATEEPESKPATTTPPPMTTNPNATAVGSGSSWRTAALYLVNNGGNCVVEKSGARISVPTEKEIPSGKFDVVEISLDRFNSLFPPLKDADLQPLEGLRDLRSVWIRPMRPGLTDAGLAFLAANSDLTSLHLEGAPDIGDGLLAHLSGAKKLQFFHLNNATRFTGRGLGGMTFLGSLKEFVCENTALSDEALAALGQCRNLEIMRIGEGAYTDEGFKSLQRLQSLRVLGANKSAFGDEAASTIAGLSNLSELNLADTKITDLGLAKLRSLKKLTSLNLTGSQVSREAAEEFQKLMPQCRVSR